MAKHYDRRNNGEKRLTMNPIPDKEYVVSRYVPEVGY